MQIRWLAVVVGVALVPCLSAQTSSGIARHINWGSSTPSKCSPVTGDIFFVASGGSGTPYYCSSTNTWAAMSGGTGSFVTLSQDAISTATGGATTVVGLNGTLLSGLASGLLFNTTGTGVPSIRAVTGSGGICALNGVCTFSSAITFSSTVNKITLTPPSTAWTIQPSGNNQTTTIPGGTLLNAAGSGLSVSASTISLCDGGTNCYYTTSGTLGPYLSINSGTTLEPSLFFVSKTTAASNATEPLIFADYAAAFDGTHAGFGVQGLVSNTGSTTATGFTGHLLGVVGNCIDTTAGGITCVGGEFRTDPRATTASPTWHYSGGFMTNVWNGSGSNPNTQNGVEIIVESCANSSTTFVNGGPNNNAAGGYLQCATPTASGTLIGVRVPPMQGGSLKYSIYADTDPGFFGGGMFAGYDGTVGGTIQLSNGSASAHTIWGSAATTSNTILGFATAPTTGHVITCTTSSTICTFTDGGVLGTAAAVNTGTSGGTVPLLNGNPTASGTWTFSAVGAITLSNMTGTSCLEEISGVVTATGSACGSGGATAWSSIGNPTSNLTLSMGTDTSTFNHTSGVAWIWANTTAAIVSASQSSPIMEWLGTEWHSSATAAGGATMQFVPGTGTDAVSTLTFLHTGSATGQMNVSFPGNVNSASSSTGSGVSITAGTGGVDAYGEGTAPSVCAAASVDCIYSDSTLHGLLTKFNGESTWTPIIRGPVSPTANHVVQWTSEGIVQDGGVLGTAAAAATAAACSGNNWSQGWTTGSNNCAQLQPANLGISSPALPNGVTATTQATGDQSTNVATDAFVASAIAATVDTHNPVQAATTTALIFSPTYSNGSSGVGATLTAGTVGVLIVDGYTPALGDRLLPKNQASTFQNGCYTVTTLGVVATTAYVLTRCADFNQTTNIEYGDTFPVLQGTTNANQQFTMNNNATITVGTTAITFAQTSGGSQLTASLPIVITGNALSAPTAVTSAATLPAGGIMYGTAGTQASAATAAATAKQVVLSGGAGAPTMIDFPHVMEIPAANCGPSSTPGAGWSTSISPICRAGTNNKGGVLPFADASTAQFDLEIPGDADLTSGNYPYIKLFFTDSANTSGTEIFQAQVSCYVADFSATDDVAFATAQVFTTRTATAANRSGSENLQFNSTSMSGCVAGASMIVLITRNTDTAASPVNVSKASITFPRLLVQGAQ